MFVDCGATVNIMPISVMITLKGWAHTIQHHHEQFCERQVQDQECLTLEVTIVSWLHLVAFFTVSLKTEYNALLGQDWIHQTSYIPSLFYKVLIFWNGKSTEVHLTDRFETNMIRAYCYSPRLQHQRVANKDIHIESCQGRCLNHLTAFGET